jgi:hypothetical protein
MRDLISALSQLDEDVSIEEKIKRFNYLLECSSKFNFIEFDNMVRDRLAVIRKMEQEKKIIDKRTYQLRTRGNWIWVCNPPTPEMNYKSSMHAIYSEIKLSKFKPEAKVSTACGAMSRLNYDDGFSKVCVGCLRRLDILDHNNLLYTKPQRYRIS